MLKEQFQKMHLIYQNLLDEIDVGVHVIDENEKTIIYNKKMMEIESMDVNEVLDKDLLDVFVFGEGQVSTLVKALKEGKATKNAKQTYFNNKGQQITTINNTFPIFQKRKIVAAIEIAKDVTKIERLLKESYNKNNTKFTFESIIGNSKRIKDVIEDARRASRTSSSVLIIGETGTGKELFAQSVHNSSQRTLQPFVTQNCAALPENLIEGLLFGTKKGAFTGSMEHEGLFEQADGGTMLLDEINSLSPYLQAKLLRAIQEKTIRRVGGTKDKNIDVRIIATINEDPIDAIANNRLRKDLYYRLSVVTLFIPPLRERKEDIPLLVQHFIEKYNYLFNMDVKGVDEQVLNLFYDYEWPGNVRELEHIIEGTMNIISNEDYISYYNLPIHFQNKMKIIESKPIISVNDTTFYPTHLEKQPLQEYLELMEKNYIKELFKKNQFNVSMTAKELSISRQSLQYRLRKFNIFKREDD